MIDMSAQAITHRLREVARSTSLRPQDRLEQKIGYEMEAVTRRLRQASALQRMCIQLGRADLDSSEEG